MLTIQEIKQIDYIVRDYLLDPKLNKSTEKWSVAERLRVKYSSFMQFNYNAETFEIDHEKLIENTKHIDQKEIAKLSKKLNKYVIDQRPDTTPNTNYAANWL